MWTEPNLDGPPPVLEALASYPVPPWLHSIHTQPLHLLLGQLECPLHLTDLDLKLLA